MQSSSYTRQLSSELQINNHLHLQQLQHSTFLLHLFWWGQQGGRYSLRLRTVLKVAHPADGFGFLTGVAVASMDHLCVSLLSTAVFGVLEPWETSDARKRQNLLTIKATEPAIYTVFNAGTLSSIQTTFNRDFNQIKRKRILESFQSLSLLRAPTTSNMSNLHFWTCFIWTFPFKQMLEC